MNCIFVHILLKSVNAKFVYLLAFIVVNAGVFNVLLAQNVMDTSRTIAVSGEGSVDVAPDKATLRFGIYSQNESPEEARLINARVAKEALNAVRTVGIPEQNIRLQTLRLQPIREYDAQTRKQVEKGYEASRELVIEVEDLDQLPLVVARVVQEGANRLNGITYGLKSIERHKDAAIVKAVERARGKAELIASSLGEEVGEVLQIREEHFDAPLPRVQYESASRAMMASTSKGAEPDAYASGMIEVRTSVSIVFRIK